MYILHYHSKTSQGAGKKGALPEGFFDDPKMDAKARKVEYKDPMTEEWEKFQKTIQKEDDVRKGSLALSWLQAIYTQCTSYMYTYMKSWWCKIEKLGEGPGSITIWNISD